MSKVGNSVTSVPLGIELNEKDYCTCLLTALKDMEKNYVIAMSEASNEWLYDIYKHTFMNIADLQRRLYILMFQNGWYQLETVTNTKLNDKYNTLNSDYTGLSEQNFDIIF